MQSRTQDLKIATEKRPSAEQEPVGAILCLPACRLRNRCRNAFMSFKRVISSTQILFNLHAASDPILYRTTWAFNCGFACAKMIIRPTISVRDACPPHRSCPENTTVVDARALSLRICRSPLPDATDFPYRLGSRILGVFNFLVFVAALVVLGVLGALLLACCCSQDHCLYFVLNASH